MKLLEFEQTPNVGSLTGKRAESDSASLGGCLLQAASEAPLSSLLNHSLSLFLESREGRSDCHQPPSSGRPGDRSAKQMFVLWLLNSCPSPGSPRPRRAAPQYRQAYKDRARPGPREPTFSF